MTSLQHQPGEEGPATVPVRKPEPVWSYLDALVLLSLALPCLALAMILVRLAGLLPVSHEAIPTAGLILAQFIAYGLWFGLIAAFLRLRYRSCFWDALGWRRPRQGYRIYVYAGPALAILVAALASATRMPDAEMPMKQILEQPSSMMLVGVFAISLGPVCEELAFRGFVLPTLARATGAVPAVVLTAALFSLLHGPQYAWSWRHLILITFAGVAFGAIRLASGSTAAAALAHAGYNFTFFAGYIAHTRGIGT